MTPEEALLIAENFPATTEDTRYRALDVLAVEVRRQHREIERLRVELQTESECCARICEDIDAQYVREGLPAWALEEAAKAIRRRKT